MALMNRIFIFLRLYLARGKPSTCLPYEVHTDVPNSSLCPTSSSAYSPRSRTPPRRVSFSAPRGGRSHLPPVAPRAMSNPRHARQLLQHIQGGSAVHGHCFSARRREHSYHPWHLPFEVLRGDQDRRERMQCPTSRGTNIPHLASLPTTKLKFPQGVVGTTSRATITQKECTHALSGSSGNIPNGVLN